MAGYLAKFRRERKTCSVAEARYVPETSFRRNNASKHVLDAAPCHNKLPFLADMLHKDPTSKLIRHGAATADAPSARGYPAVTKVTKAALPASLAAANASSTRPPIPRLMAATSGGLMTASKLVQQLIVVIIGADEMNMRWLSSGLVAPESGSDLLTNEGGLLKKAGWR